MMDLILHDGIGMLFGLADYPLPIEIRVYD